MEFLGAIVPSQEKAGGFPKSPTEIDVPDLAVFGSLFFTCRFVLRFDKSAIGQKVPDGRKPVDIIDLQKNHQGKGFSDSGNGFQKSASDRIMGSE